MGVIKCQTFFILFMIAVGAFIFLDVNEHNSFKDSNNFPRGQGILQYVKLYFTRFRTSCRRFYWWSKQHVPVYLSKAREGVVPCLIVIKDVVTSLAVHLWTSIKISYQYIIDKKPLLYKWANHYTPGLWESIQQWAADAWLLFLEYTRLLVYLVLKYLSLTLQWLKDNVFVGNLSPENLQKYAVDVFAFTWTCTKEAVTWLQDKLTPIIATS